jgi:hypothetical protein
MEGSAGFYRKAEPNWLRLCGRTMQPGFLALGLLGLRQSTSGIAAFSAVVKVVNTATTRKYFRPITG